MNMKRRLATAARRFRLRGRTRQELLPFQKRTQCLSRVFRGLIVAVTLVPLAGAWALLPSGRSTILALAHRARWGAMRRFGFEPPRSEIDAYWRDRRDRREAQTRALYATKFAALNPESQAFLRAAGMSPEEAAIGWGNYDMTLVMSGEVFARVDSGRQYQLRPGVRSIWFRQIGVLGKDLCVSQLPGTPEVRRLAGPAGAEIISGPIQTTNSWGCRGPEPDVNCPVRGLVLGDSFMQGFLVDDDETPPERLRQSLQAAIGAQVSLLNTGTLGYSPEHYYFTLREFADRFRPGFVVVGLYSNDFGEDAEVLRGEGDWTEGAHWLELILRFCRARQIVCLFAPVPCESQIVGPRNQGNYPGQVSIITGISGRYFCDSTDAFIDEDLKVRPPRILSGRRCHLFNGHLGDGHLSRDGAALWGRVVAHRLALLFGKQPPGAHVTAGGAKSTGTQNR